MVYIAQFLDWLSYNSGAWAYDGMSWVRFFSYR